MFTTSDSPSSHHPNGDEITALSTSKVILVPYSPWHVPRYHEWMQDEEIQEATASEPLTLEEEYAMQRSWREDADKLTFIVCRPDSHHHNHNDGNNNDDVDGDGTACTHNNTAPHLHPNHDSPATMLGDINLFLRVDDGDDGAAPPQIIGEIELMIAEKANQRRGFGRASLLTFLRYISDHQREILNEFLRGRDVDAEKISKLKLNAAASSTGSAETDDDTSIEELAFSCLSVKIGQSNTRSLALFESLAFEKVAAEPNVFGEFELRRIDLRRDAVDRDLALAGVEGFVEIPYERKE